MTIPIVVRGQELIAPKDFRAITQGSRDFLKLQFYAPTGEMGENVSSWTVQFLQGDNVYESTSDLDGVVAVPPELEPGDVKIVAKGVVSPGVHMVTNTLKLRVLESPAGPGLGVVDIEPTPSSKSNFSEASERVFEVEESGGYANIETMEGFVSLDQDSLQNRSSAHDHPNMEVLDRLTTEVVDRSHNHENINIVEQIDEDIIDNSHSHDNMDALDSVPNTLVENSHSHAFKRVLDEMQYNTMSEMMDVYNPLAEEVSLSLEEIWDAIEDISEHTPIYGVRFVGSGNEYPYAKRLFNASTMVAEVGTDTEAAENDFDRAYPWSGRRRLCGDFNEEKNMIINAYEGEPGYATDGSNGNVWVETPLFFYKHEYLEGDVENILISGYPYPGFEPAPMFKKPDGSVIHKAYTAAYLAGDADDGLVSVSGVFPRIDTLYGHIDNVRSAGDNYITTTSDEWYTKCLLMWVEFATRDIGSVMAGAVSMQAYSIPSSEYEEDEDGTFTIRSGGTFNEHLFAKGQSYNIGYSGLFPDAITNAVVSEITYTGRLKFEGPGLPVVIPNVPIYVFPAPWKNGSCDTVLSSSGSLGNNNTGAYPCVYRGEENPFGNARQVLSDIIVKKEIMGSSYVRSFYMIGDPTLIDTDNEDSSYITPDYEPTGIEAPSTEGYVKKLSLYSDGHKRVLQSSVDPGGNSSSYYASKFERHTTDRDECFLAIGPHLSSQDTFPSPAGRGVYSAMYGLSKGSVVEDLFVDIFGARASYYRL